MKKGIKGKFINCDECHTAFYRANSVIRGKNFCNMTCRAVYAKNDPDHASWNRGIKRTNAQNLKQSIIKKEEYRSGSGIHHFLGKKRPEMTGINNWKWKGNQSEQALKHRLRGSLDWKQWRSSIFARDNFSCIDCGAHGVYLEPHHVIPLKKTLSRAFDITNGITLCRPCHVKTMGKELQLASTYFSLIPAQV